MFLMMEFLLSSLFSFHRYGFVGFQIQTNYKICTKFRDKFWMFEINFCNHTLALRKNKFLTKRVACEGVKPQLLKEL